MDKKDFDHCSSLATDVLVGAKLKALEKAYDGLKLVRRGCKAADKASLRTLSASSSTSVTLAASADVPCGTHSVPGLPRSADEIPGSTDCGACAERIRKSLGGGKIVTIRPASPNMSNLGRYRGRDSFWGSHIVVVHNDRVYDGFTGRAGETVAEYKARWDWPDVINFGF